MKPWFNFKNINSRDKGLSILKLPPRIKPEIRGEMITIPGRDGFLFESEDAYNGKTLEIECTFLPPDNKTPQQIDTMIKEILVWLDGDGKLIFSDYPDYYYDAKVINAIPIERLFKRYRRFMLAFEVQPFAKSNNVITENIVAGSTQNVVVSTHLNITSYYKVKPILTLTGEGNIDISINNNIIHLSNLDRKIIIDTEMMNCVDEEGDNMNSYMTGDFPTLEPGDNEFLITPLSNASFVSLKVEYRSLWL